MSATEFRCRKSGDLKQQLKIQFLLAMDCTRHRSLPGGCLTVEGHVRLGDITAIEFK